MRTVKYSSSPYAALLVVLGATCATAAISPARACDKSPNSAWLTAGQSTKDFAGLQILLDAASFNRVSADEYHISIKFNGKPATIVTQAQGAPAAAPATNVKIGPNMSIEVDTGQCGTVHIGANRTSQPNTVELHWSYF